MPIRFIQLYSSQTELPLSTLDNTIIAIDGFWFLRKYLCISTNDHFDNYPQVLKECLDPIIKLKQKASILWIWDGLEFRQPPAFNLDKIVYANYTKIQKSGMFNKSLLDQELFVDLATPFLRENGITVIRSPYSAAAQCAYYLRESCVQYVFGKVDTLLFENCSKVITEFDFSKSVMHVFDRNSFFKSNNIQLEAFRRLAFVSGCEYCPTHPFYASSFDFFEMLEMIKSNTTLSVLDALNTPNEEFQRYKTEYQQAFIIVDFNPVMYLDGIVRPLCSSPCPEDLDKIFGERQSDFIYSQIFTCSIGVKILSARMFQKLSCFYKKNLCSAFKAILNTRPNDVSKNHDLYDFLSKKLEIKVTWDDQFPKLVQLVFMSLVDCDFDSRGLIKLLNLGTKISNSQPGDLSFESKYSQENLKYFYLFNEVFILYKDLCKLAKAMFKFEQSFDFELSFDKIANSQLNPEIGQFVSENCKNAVRMKEILALL